MCISFVVCFARIAVINDDANISQKGICFYNQRLDCLVVDMEICTMFILTNKFFDE